MVIMKKRNLNRPANNSQVNILDNLIFKKFPMSAIDKVSFLSFFNFLISTFCYSLIRTGLITNVLSFWNLNKKLF